jgi:hypothetical protein
MCATLARMGVTRVIIIMIGIRAAKTHVTATFLTRPAGVLLHATPVIVAKRSPVILIIVMVDLQPPCLHQNSCYSCHQAPPSTPNRHPRTQQLPPRV